MHRQVAARAWVGQQTVLLHTPHTERTSHPQPDFELFSTQRPQAEKQLSPAYSLQQPSADAKQQWMVMTGKESSSGLLAVGSRLLGLCHVGRHTWRAESRNLAHRKQSTSFPALFSATLSASPQIWSMRCSRLRHRSRKSATYASKISERGSCRDVERHASGAPQLGAQPTPGVRPRPGS